jgi:hypothetical protein
VSKLEVKEVLKLLYNLAVLLYDIEKERMTQTQRERLADLIEEIEKELKN